jgi:predicted nuclease of predicted toxin-antitoxin system
MNLSPSWVPVFESNGHSARHWSEIGKPGAADREVLDWAKANNYVLFTHDLDFGAILAATDFDSPSVIQLRKQDINPNNDQKELFEVLVRFKDEIEKGAIISIDKLGSRVRILPINR